MPQVVTPVTPVRVYYIAIFHYEVKQLRMTTKIVHLWHINVSHDRIEYITWQFTLLVQDQRKFESASGPRPAGHLCGGQEFAGLSRCRRRWFHSTAWSPPMTSDCWRCIRILTSPTASLNHVLLSFWIVNIIERLIELCLTHYRPTTAQLSVYFHHRASPKVR